MQTLSTDNSKTAPMLSVVTVVFNGVKGIARTMDSVLAQDYPNIEYIIVDGESTDGTREIIHQYESKLDVFVCERDEGVYDAMNKAIARASGEFLLFMNCGDAFASTDAVSSAMQFVESGSDQILFGQWMRRARDDSLSYCRPDFEKGLFNHQAIVYSRHIHAWHGGYVNVKGLTTADYLFFATLFSSTSVTCMIIETRIAVIDVYGLSAGTHTLAQKYAIDFICGRTGRLKLLTVLAAHPIYRWVKVMLGRWWR